MDYFLQQDIDQLFHTFQSRLNDTLSEKLPHTVVAALSEDLDDEISSLKAQLIGRLNREYRP